MDCHVFFYHINVIEDFSFCHEEIQFTKNQAMKKLEQLNSRQTYVGNPSFCGGTYICHVLGRNSEEVGTDPTNSGNNGKATPNPHSRFQPIHIENVGHNLVEDDGNNERHQGKK